MKRERATCWIVSKKFCHALSPKQITRVRCTERTSLSFPRFRHNCGDRGRHAGGTGPTAPFRRCYGRGKIWGRLAGAAGSKRGERRRSPYCESRRESPSYRASVTILDFEPRSRRAINMGRRTVDDDDGYVPRFRLAPLLFSTRRVAHVGCSRFGRKIRRTFSDESAAAAHKRRVFSTKCDSYF